MTARTICFATALAATILAIPSSSDAAGKPARARFTMEALADCQQPALQNIPIRAEGTGVLSADRTATLDMDSNVEGRVQYTATLGGKPHEAPGGSTSLRVAGKHTLKAIRDYPNNSIVVYMTVIGNSCTLRIENRLKPGKRQYTFQSHFGIAYCSRPRIVRADCVPY
ncbi:MAG: hypothetical protein PS018_01395 [bacterium]|nr:hypothetical protein [bacterium]